MAKNKLRRFKEMDEMSCVFQPNFEEVTTDTFKMKGNWHTNYFKNNHPIIVELGCGKGEYTIGLGKKYPHQNYIGVDIKGARIWEAAHVVEENNIQNIGFVRGRIDFVQTFFGENEIEEIWLTFSDPQPKKPNKRLSSKVFIDKYGQFLKPGGIIHLKTDSDLLFESTLEQIEENKYQLLEKTWDLYKEMPDSLDQETKEILSIKTHYETIFSAKGFTIKYCKFKIS